MSRRLILLVQALGSALVLSLLVRDAEWARVRAALDGVAPGWLLAALAAKVIGVTAREIRLWIALTPWGRPPFPRVLSIGYATGLVNNVLPARGGDLLGAALLTAECRLSSTAALAAVGVTSLVEALVFGIFLLGLIAMNATRWRDLLGPAQVAEATGGLTLLTLGAVFGSVAVVILGRRLRPRRPDPDAAPRPGAGEWIRRAVVDAGRGLDALGPLAANVAFAALQAGCMVGCYRLIFLALGLTPPLPWLAAAFVVGVGSFAAVILPPSMAAGGAATAVAVLATFGVDEASALAFAALAWVAHLAPIVALGAWPLWVRLGRLPGRGSLSVSSEP